MKTIVRTVVLASALTVVGLSASEARAQYYGATVGGPGVSVTIGGGGYFPGYYRPYPVVPPPVVVAPRPPVVVVPSPVFVPRPYYGGYYRGYRSYGYQRGGYGYRGPYRY